jgi:3-carboxy-cis,cis-muconate cycloisomerase
VTWPALERFLASPAIVAVFDDAALLQAMFDFEAALVRAQAACGRVPASAATTIAHLCRAELYDGPALVAASARAGSLAIPLVQELTRAVALVDPHATPYVHQGSTSQDVLDTALAILTRRALALVDADLAATVQSLLALADAHADTPVTARTLLQPAQVSSFGLKCVQWAEPLQRARERLREQAARGLALQLGGAAGHGGALGADGPAIAAHMAAALHLAAPDAAWHTQRDEWVRLGLEAAVLTGSLGKIATDLALMGQAEVAEVAEPTAPGRGGSSAMPHKRNPVGAMVALAQAHRAPQRAATLLATLGPAHERGLGDWQASLAEWPALWVGAHGALAALKDVLARLQVFPDAMARHLDALQGVLHAEAAAALLAPALGKAAAHQRIEALCARALAEHQPLPALLKAALRDDADLRGAMGPDAVDAVFDRAAAVRWPAAEARRRAAALAAAAARLPVLAPPPDDSGDPV